MTGDLLFYKSNRRSTPNYAQKEIHTCSSNNVRCGVVQTLVRWRPCPRLPKCK